VEAVAVDGRERSEAGHRGAGHREAGHREAGNREAGNHGEPHCLIVPLPPPPPSSAAWLDPPKRITVTVSAGDAGRTYRRETTWSAPFVAAFSVTTQPPPVGADLDADLDAGLDASLDGAARAPPSSTPRVPRPDATPPQRCVLRRVGERATVTLRGSDLAAVGASSSSADVAVALARHVPAEADGGADASEYVVSSRAEATRAEIVFEHPRTRQREVVCVTFLRALPADAKAGGAAGGGATQRPGAGPHGSPVAGGRVEAEIFGVTFTPLTAVLSAVAAAVLLQGLLGGSKGGGGARARRAAGRGTPGSARRATLAGTPGGDELERTPFRSYSTPFSHSAKSPFRSSTGRRTGGRAGDFY
jgi:hypothetical protein